MSDYKRSTGTKRLRGSLDASDHRPRQRSRPDHEQTARHDRWRLMHHVVGGRWSLVWSVAASKDHDYDHDDEFTNTAETMTDDKGLVSREGMRDLRTLPGHADEFTNTADTTNKKTTTTDEGHAKTTTRQERARSCGHVRRPYKPRHHCGQSEGPPVKGTSEGHQCDPFSVVISLVL